MKKSCALLVILASLSAFADPLPVDDLGGAAVIVKSGIVEDPNGATWEVGPGLYVNGVAWKHVQNGFGALQAQNQDLTNKLKSANQKILDCAATIPGLPTWAYVAISAGLTILTGVASYFMVKDSVK